MCLEKGTPERLRLHRLGVELPPLADTREALIAALRKEILAGDYARPGNYHPLLGILLTGLATADMRLPAYFRTPSLPLCDAIQGASLVFGIIRNVDWFPDIGLQAQFLEHSHSDFDGRNYALARQIIKRSCGPEMRYLCWEEMRQLRGHCGAIGMMVDEGCDDGWVGAVEGKDADHEHCPDGHCH